MSTKKGKNKKKGGKNSNAPPSTPAPTLSNDNATSGDEGSFHGSGSNPPYPEREERRDTLNEKLLASRSEYERGNYYEAISIGNEVLESMSIGEKKKFGVNFALVINNSFQRIAKSEDRGLSLGEITLSLNLFMETLVMGDDKDAQLMARDRVMKLTYEMIENATKVGTNRPEDMDTCLRLLSDCTRWCLGDTSNQAEDNNNAIDRLGKAQEMVAAGFSRVSPDAEKSWYILGDGRCAVRLIIYLLTRGGKVITIGGLQSNPKTDYRRDNSMETRKFLAAAFIAYARKNLEHWETIRSGSDEGKALAEAMIDDTGEGEAQYSHIGQAEDQVERYTNALSDGSLLKVSIPYELWAIDPILLGAAELHEEKVEVHVNGRYRYDFGEDYSSGSSLPIILNNVCDNGQGIHYDLQYHRDRSINPDVHENYVPPEPAFEEGDRVSVTVPDASGEDEEVYEGTVVGYDAVHQEYFVNFDSQDAPQQAFSEDELTRVGDNGGGRSAEQVIIDRVQHKKDNGTWLRKHEKTERSEQYDEKYPDGPSGNESTNLPTPKHADTPSSTVKCLDTANTLYTEGKKCQADNNHDEAIDKFISALDHTPMEDVQLARAIELDLAQCMYHRYETVPSKLVEALAILDDHLRHREGSEKSQSLHLAVSIHLSIMQNEDTSNLGSILSSYQHLTTYIEHLRTDDTLPLDTDYNLTQIQEATDNKLADLISQQDDVDETLPDSLKLLSMCTINKNLVKRAGELSAADSSTLEPHLQSVQDYMPLLDRLYKHVKTKQDGGSISDKDVDGLVRDAKRIDDSIVASTNNVKDKKGNSSVANTSEPINKNASTIHLSNYSPEEDAGFVATNPSRVAAGNKLDRECNLCMNKIGQRLPRSLSRGAGVDPDSVVNDELAERQVHFDACITVIGKPAYDKKEEPAGFITCSGCRDDQDYYLPAACKIAVQIAIRFISSGKLSVLTSWSKEGGDNILEVNGANLSPLVMVMGRLPHPDYMRDPEKLIKSRNHFTKYNRTLTGSYSALGILCPSVGDTYEYHAGCKHWTEEDYKEQEAAEHKNCVFGGTTTSILRREGLDFIDEYIANHKHEGSEEEVFADALAKLRTLSVTHANLVEGHKKGVKTAGEMHTLASELHKVDDDYNELSPEWKFIFDLHMARKKMDETTFKSYLQKLHGTNNFKSGKTEEEFNKQQSANAQSRWDKRTQKEIRESKGWAVTLSCPNKGKGCTFTRTKGLNAYNKMKEARGNPQFRCPDCKNNGNKVGGWTETKPFQVKVKDDSSKQTTLSEPTKKRGSKTSTDTSQKEPTKKRGSKTSTDTSKKETKKKRGSKTSTDISQKKTITTTKRKKTTSTTKKSSTNIKNDPSTTTKKKKMTTLKQQTINFKPQTKVKSKRKITTADTSIQPTIVSNKKQKKTKKKERWECKCLNENDLNLTRCSFCGKPRA